MVKPKKRSPAQNRAMHKLFDLLSDELNEKGLTIQKVLKPTVDVWWNRTLVKEYLWRPIQKAVTLKESSAELNTKELDKVFETLAFHLGEKFGLEVTFPSIDEVINKQREN